MSIPFKVVAPVLFVFAALLSGCAQQFGDMSPEDDDNIGSTTAGSKEVKDMAQEMARDLIALKPIAEAAKPPTIAFAKIANRSSEPMDTEMLQEEIRMLLLQNAGGRFAFLNRAKMQEVLNERDMKRKGEIDSTGKKNLLGADYFLSGSVSTIDKTDGTKRVTYSRFEFNLTDAESSQMIWAKSYDVKKWSKKSVWDK